MNHDYVSNNRKLDGMCFVGLFLCCQSQFWLVGIPRLSSDTMNNVHATQSCEFFSSTDDYGIQRACLNLTPEPAILGDFILFL